MTKDKILPENVKKDLLKVAADEWRVKSDRREAWIIAPLMIAAGLGSSLQNVWVALPFILFAAYHVIRYIPECLESAATKKKIRAAMERCDFSVSVERLSHVSTETVWEPHSRVGRSRKTKVITVFYFLSGISWRLPSAALHYEWSTEMKLSGKGMMNTSVRDNDFYVITLKGYPSVAYVYNTKLFELGAGLEIKN